MTHQYGALGDTFYFGFSVNNTSGSGVDGTTPLFDVRLGGAAASAAPVLSGTPDILTHANFQPGAYECAIAATTGNGFVADSVYLVFATVTADGQTPAGSVGSFRLREVAGEDQVGNIGSASGGGLPFEAVIDNAITDTIDNAAAVDKGGGLVGIPITGHAFTADFEVTIASTTNYNGSFKVESQTTNEIVITDTFVSETFAGTETCVASIKGVVKVGTQTSGTFASTEALDGTLHLLTNVGDNLDWAYQFPIGSSRTARELLLHFYLTGNNDTMNVQAYNFIGDNWETRLVLQGTSQTTFQTETVRLLSKHTGTSGDFIGKVLIRFVDATAAGHVLAIDEMLVDAVAISQATGYALGRTWINTVSGKTGQVLFENGTVDNPCLNLTDALAIAALRNNRDFHISSDSSLTLDQDFVNANLYGIGYTMAFAGFDIAGTHIYHASPLTGIVTTVANSDHGDVLDAIVGNVTVNDFHFTNCSFTATVTLGAVNSPVRFIGCRSVIAGASTPVIDFGTSSADHNVTVADWQNGLEIKNFNVTTTGGTDLLSISGTGQLIIASTCDGGTINLRGQWQVTDNSGGAVTITRDDVSALVSAILPAKNTALSDVEFLMVDETDFTTPETGLTVAGTRSIDGGAFAAVTGTIAEVANGIYQIDASAADMNAGIVTFRFTATGAADRFLTIRTSG